MNNFTFKSNQYPTELTFTAQHCSNKIVADFDEDESFSLPLLNSTKIQKAEKISGSQVRGLFSSNASDINQFHFSIKRNKIETELDKISKKENEMEKIKADKDSGCETESEMSEWEIIKDDLNQQLKSLKEEDSDSKNKIENLNLEIEKLKRTATKVKILSKRNIGVQRVKNRILEEKVEHLEKQNKEIIKKDFFCGALTATVALACLKFIQKL